MLTTAIHESLMRIRRVSLRAFALLVLGIILGATAAAGDPGPGTDLRIETTPLELLGSEQSAIYEKILAPDKPVSWQVYLPANPKIATAGVLVYVSPMDSGDIDPRWREVMDRQNLIYISANDMGNEIPTSRRIVMANLAVQVLAISHAFDPGRM